MSAATTALVLAETRGPPAALAVTAAPVAEGGDATIHAVEGRPELVAKLYRDPGGDRRRRAKLEAMLASAPAGREAEHNGRQLVQLAWPLALIEREGRETEAPPAGFVMARVHLEDAVVLEQLLSGRSRRAAGLPDGVRARVAAARNLAAVVAALHAEGHHVIDLKPSNVHVYRDTFFVAVLDCDGFSVAGPDGERFPAHQYTDGYIAPEALRAQSLPETLGEAQDRFALAVMVFRLLNRGLHPFQGVPAQGASVPTTDGERVAAGLYPYGSGADRLSPPPASLYSAFDPATQRLFDLAFDGTEAGRPSAAGWTQHLSTLLAPDGLRPCPQNPDHAIYPGVADCGVCGQGARPTPRPSQPPVAGATPAAGGALAGPASSPGLLSTRRGYIGALVALSVAWFMFFQLVFDEPEVSDYDTYYENSSTDDSFGPEADPPPPPPPETYGEADVPPKLVGGLAALAERAGYPEVARQAGARGIVTVDVLVDEWGQPIDAVFAGAEYYGMPESPDQEREAVSALEGAAVQALRESTFVPGTLDGQPVTARVSVMVGFGLKLRDPFPSADRPR